MNAANGESAKIRSAPSRVPLRGSMRKSSAPNATTVSAAKTGFTSHSAPTSEPRASIAGPPIGNWP